MSIGEMGEDKHEALNSSQPPLAEGGPARFAWSKPLPGHFIATRLVPRLLHLIGRWRRGMTLGVRGLVIDEAGRVLLVRHSYVPGWSLPGGGVERGETALDALTRELLEEAAIEVQALPRLHGLLLNTHLSRRDHVAVYVVERFHAGTPRLPNSEIVEIGFFAPDALPEATTPATRRRIAEVMEGLPPAPEW